MTIPIDNDAPTTTPTYKDKACGTDETLVKGIRISCDGEMSLLGKKPYYPVEFSKKDPVFRDWQLVGDGLDGVEHIPSDPVSHISTLVGLPVRIRRIPSTLAWESHFSSCAYHNVPATILLVDLESRYRPVPPDCLWQDYLGSVLVTSVRGEEISSQQVEALVVYTYIHIIRPLVEVERKQKPFRKIYYPALDPSFVARKKIVDEVLPSITPQAFQKFLCWFTMMKEKDEPRWALASNPVRSSTENEWLPTWPIAPYPTCTLQ
ncbi:hypothetical protein ACLMJK_004660 [Lecanora helva]